MTAIEKMRGAKALLEEESSGAYELAVGNVHNNLHLRCSDKANAGIYLSVVPNRKTGNYDCVLKGYTRCSGGYLGAAQMQGLADEYQMAATLVKELESAKISLTHDEMNYFVAEIKSAEEQQINVPQMGM